MANPVDYDTRYGCTLLGAGMGAMHPVSYHHETYRPCSGKLKLDTKGCNTGQGTV